MHVGASSGRSDRGAGASVSVDRRVTVFSANGRLDQVDYAWNATRLAGVTSVGVRGADSVCVVDQRKASAPKDKLLDMTSVSRLFPITERLGLLLATGIGGEGRALAHEARNQAGKFCSKLGYEMSADVLAQWIADRTKIWTQYGAKRPSGVVAMILGIDEEKETPQLSTCDPAGYFLSHKAASAGQRDREAVNFLEKKTKNNPSLSFQETVQMAISALQFALKVDLKANVQALDIPGMYRHQDTQGSGGEETTLRFSILRKWYKALESLRADIEFAKKRRLSTSAPKTVSSLQNGVVFSLNGSKFMILFSYINAIIHYRLWNYVRGTCVDLQTIFGTDKKFYTTACEDTFHLLVEFEEDLIDLIIDGKQSWFHAIIKKIYSIKFLQTGNDDYMEGVDCKELNFSGQYKHIAPNDDAGEIPIGLPALKSAFKASSDYCGQTSPELQKALGTWVIYFGESPKFHKVFLACCKSIVMEKFDTLNKVDKGLGLMVREWGSLCRIAMRWVLKSLAGRPVPAIDEEIDEIMRKGVPGIKSVKDIFNNICLWTNSSPYQSAFVQDLRSKEKPSFSPLNISSTDEYAKELVKFYKDKIDSKTPADTSIFDRDRPSFKTLDETKISKICPSFYAEFSSDEDFVKDLAKLYGTKIQEAEILSPSISEANAEKISYDFAKKMSLKDEMLLMDNGWESWKKGLPHELVSKFAEGRMSKLFCASSWHSDLNINHGGPSISQASIVTRVPGVRNLLGSRHIRFLAKMLRYKK